MTGKYEIEIYNNRVHYFLHGADSRGLGTAA